MEDDLSAVAAGWFQIAHSPASELLLFLVIFSDTAELPSCSIADLLRLIRPTELVDDFIETERSFSLSSLGEEADCASLLLCAILSVLRWAVAAVSRSTLGWVALDQTKLLTRPAAPVPLTQRVSWARPQSATQKTQLQEGKTATWTVSIVKANAALFFAQVNLVNWK